MDRFFMSPRTKFSRETGFSWKIIWDQNCAFSLLGFASSMRFGLDRPPIISPGKKSWKWNECLWKNLFRFRRVPFTTTVDEPVFRVNCKQSRIKAKVASLTIRKTPRNSQICHVASPFLMHTYFAVTISGNEVSLDSSYIQLPVLAGLMCLLVLF